MLRSVTKIGLVLLATFGLGCGEIPILEEKEEKENDGYDDPECRGLSRNSTSKHIEGVHIQHDDHEEGEESNRDITTDSAESERKSGEAELPSGQARGKMSRQIRGASVGNGGDAVVCRDSDDDIERLMFLDLFEAELRGLKVQVEGSEIDEIVGAWLLDSVFSRHDPDRSHRYAEWYRSFWDEVVWIPEGIVLSDVYDAGSTHIPSGCQLEQFIVQKAIGKHRYSINKPLWDEFVERDQAIHLAAAVVHELVYREAIELNKTSSEEVRYLVGAIISDMLSSYSQVDYRELVEALKFPVIETRLGIPFILGSIVDSEDYFEGELVYLTEFGWLATGSQTVDYAHYQGQVKISQSVKVNDVVNDPRAIGQPLLLEGSLADRIRLSYCEIRGNSKHSRGVGIDPGDKIQFDLFGYPITINGQAWMSYVNQN